MMRSSDFDELLRIQDALSSCGISGIYDEFYGDPAEAIKQMDMYIKERDKYIESLELQLDVLRGVMSDVY